MRIGRLDRRVMLLRRTVTQGSAGDAQESFTDLAEVWAERQDVSGREYVRSGQQLAERTARFTIRWRGDFTSIDRLSHDGQEWVVLNVAEVGRREGLEITAQIIQGD